MGGPYQQFLRSVIWKTKVQAAALCCSGNSVSWVKDKAKIGDPHVALGLVAGDGGAAIWPQRIGFGRAKEYLLTGEL